MLKNYYKDRVQRWESSVNLLTTSRMIPLHWGPRPTAEPGLQALMEGQKGWCNSHLWGYVTKATVERFLLLDPSHWNSLTDWARTMPSLLARGGLIPIGVRGYHYMYMNYNEWVKQCQLPACLPKIHVEITVN